MCSKVRTCPRPSSCSRETSCSHPIRDRSSSGLPTPSLPLLCTSSLRARGLTSRSHNTTNTTCTKRITNTPRIYPMPWTRGHRCPLPAPRFPPRVSDNRQATRRQHRCYDDPDRSQQNDAFKAPLLGRTIFQLLCVRRTIVPRSVASASCEDAFLIRSTICRYGRNLAPFI